MRTVQCAQWSDFRRLVDEERLPCPVYWRGNLDQRWPLASSFERQILSLHGGGRPDAPMIYPYGGRLQRPDGSPVWQPGFYAHLRDRYLHAFQQAAAGLRGPNPQTLDEDQWWALGRHYGLITPLLDWTDKPYIGAFFAFSDYYSRFGHEPTGNCITIYRLAHDERLEGDGLRVVRPVVDELGRMHGQRGLFTWLDSERYFELQGFLDDTGRGDLLTRILIDDRALIDGLHDFQMYGIDYRTLFPDLSGAAMHANADFTLFEKP